MRTCPDPGRAPRRTCGSHTPVWGQALLCWWDEALLLHLPEDLARPKATAGHCREWDRLDHRSGRFQEGSTSFLLPSILSRGFLSTQAPHPNLSCQAAPREACRFCTPCTYGQQPPPTLAGAKLPGAPGLPGPPPAPPSPPEALPLIGAKVIVQPVFKSLVRGGGGALQLARGSAMEGQRSERPTGGGHTPTGSQGSLGGAVTPTCSHLAPPKLGAEGGSGLGSAAEAGKKQGEVLQPRVGGTAAPRLPMPAGRPQGSRPKQALGRNLEPFRPESRHTRGRRRGGPLGTPGVNRELSLRPVTPEHQPPTHERTQDARQGDGSPWGRGQPSGRTGDVNSSQTGSYRDAVCCGHRSEERGMVLLLQTYLYWLNFY